MICPFGSDQGYRVPSYKDYKNRAFTRHKKKLEDSLRQIRDCSLKPQNKNALREEMIAMIKADMAPTTNN